MDIDAEHGLSYPRYHLAVLKSSALPSNEECAHGMDRNVPEPQEGSASGRS